MARTAEEILKDIQNDPELKRRLYEILLFGYPDAID
jgi:hypothetical protein